MKQGFIIRVLKTVAKHRGLKIAERQIFFTHTFGQVTDTESCLGFSIAMEKHPKANARMDIAVGYLGNVAMGVGGGGAEGLGALASGGVSAGGHVNDGRQATKSASGAHMAGVRAMRPAGPDATHQMQINQSLVSMQAQANNIGAFGLIKVTELDVIVALTDEKRIFDIWCASVVADPNAISEITGKMTYLRGSHKGSPALMADGNLLPLEGNIFAEHGL